MKKQTKINILFLSSWIILLIISIIGAVKGNNFLWIGGMVFEILILFLCILLQFKYCNSEKDEGAK